MKEQSNWSATEAWSELELKADGETREEYFSSGGVGSDAVEAVAGIDADDVVSEAGDDTEVPFVTIEGIQFSDAKLQVVHVGTRRGVTRKLVAGGTEAAIDAEVPLETLAEKAKGSEAYALEEFEGPLAKGDTANVNGTHGREEGGDERVGTLQRVGGDIIAVEAVVGVLVSETDAEAVDLAEGTEDANTVVPTGRPEIGTQLIAVGLDGQAEAEIKIPTPSVVVAPHRGDEVAIATCEVRGDGIAADEGPIDKASHAGVFLVFLPGKFDAIGVSRQVDGHGAVEDGALAEGEDIALVGIIHIHFAVVGEQVVLRAAEGVEEVAVLDGTCGNYADAVFFDNEAEGGGHTPPAFGHLP